MRGTQRPCQSSGSHEMQRQRVQGQVQVQESKDTAMTACRKCPKSGPRHPHHEPQQCHWMTEDM
eukprot:1563653-Lingulodinium_polyedra.AAC.1